MKNKKLFAILTLVCFMMTLMPVAAFAAADADTSYIYTVEANPTVRLGATPAEISFDFRNVSNAADTTGAVTIWVTEEGKTTPSSALNKVGTTSASGNVVQLASPVSNAEYAITFNRAGTFYIHAALGNLTAAQVEDAAQLNTEASHNKIVVKNPVVDTEYAFGYDLLGDGTIDDYVFDGEALFPASVPADGLVKAGLGNGEVELKLYRAVYGTDSNSNSVRDDNEYTYTPVKGETVSIETSSSNIEVSDEKVVTSATGRVLFDVVGLREGSYEVFVSAGSCEVKLPVGVVVEKPAYIDVVKAPTTPVSLDTIDAASAANKKLSDIVRFLITDINGNALDASTLTATDAAAFGTNDAKYVTIVSKPAASTLRNANVWLEFDAQAPGYATLKFDTAIVVPGTYEFKVALDNGKATYVTVEFAKFGTPVAIELEYAAPAVELGGTVLASKINFVDANGVREDARTKVELAASGYAIDTLAAGGAVTVKDDEKYLGSTVTVTAVSERYGLMTSATIKVVAEAAGLMFTSKTAEVNMNNSIQGVLVDAMGNRTALSNADTIGGVADLSYIVLDKPEDAKVSVNFPTADNKLTTGGSFVMNLTSNKVGTVKVQVMAKVTNAAAGSGAVTKYYTGIGEIAFGTGEVGKAVVLSIGSSTMIVDGKAVVLEDTKAIIKNNRTFVPFRALAEAFGAKVDYNAADHSVVATLNGVTVVMPIGSNTYTVNDIVKTADVAAFVDENNRTLVPVKFVANAFGIEVKPIFNDDGTVSDVLFNM